MPLACQTFDLVVSVTLSDPGKICRERYLVNDSYHYLEVTHHTTELVFINLLQPPDNTCGAAWSSHRNPAPSRLVWALPSQLGASFIGFLSASGTRCYFFPAFEPWRHNLQGDLWREKASGGCVGGRGLPARLHSKTRVSHCHRVNWFLLGIGCVSRTESC